MKKSFLLISILIICLSSCNKGKNPVAETDTEVKTVAAVESKTEENQAPEKPQTEESTDDTPGFQNKDPMRSDYRESRADGYTWRYRDCTYDKNDTVLTKEKLLSTLWSMDTSVNQYYCLCFYTDGVFKAGTRQAGVDCEGTYEVRDGKVYMKTSKQNDIGIDAYFPVSDEEFSGELNCNSDNVTYAHELVINGYKFFPGKCIKENGEKALLNGIPVIVEIRNAVATDNVKLRAGPGVNYEQLNCDYTTYVISERYPKAHVEKPAPLLRYTIFTILARSEKKEKIGDDEAYWYYIGCSDGFESIDYSWIYGAWVQDYEESLREVYWDKWLSSAKDKYNLRQWEEP